MSAKHRGKAVAGIAILIALVLGGVLLYLYRDKYNEEKYWKMLTEGSEAERKTAILVLAEKRSRRAIPYFVEQTLQESEFADACRKALEDMGTEVIDELIRVLSDTSRDVKVLNNAAFMIVEIGQGHRETAAKLIAAYNGATMNNVGFALSHLLRADPEIRPVDIVDALKGKEVEEHRDLLYMIAPLLGMVPPEEDPARLAGMAPPAPVPPVPGPGPGISLPGVQPPRDPNEIQMHDHVPDIVLPVILAGFEEEDERIRIAAAQCLAESKHRAASSVPALIRALDDSSAFVRSAAAGTLEKLASAAEETESVKLEKKIRAALGTAVPALQLTLMDPEEAVAQSAASALLRIDRESLIDATRNERAAVRRVAVATIGFNALDVALDELVERVQKDDDDGVRRAAIQAIAQMGAGAGDAVDSLLKIVANCGDEVDDIELEAVSTLGDIGRSPDRVVPALIDLLGHSDGNMRLGACLALEKYGVRAESAIPALTKLMRDRAMTETVALVLAALGEKAIPPLVGLLSEEDPYLRWVGVAALGNAGELAAPAAGKLGELLGDRSEQVRLAAVDTLGKIGPGARDAIDALVKALGSKDFAYRQMVALSLAKIDRKTIRFTAPVFVELFRREVLDEGARIDILEGLKPIRSEHVLPVLVMAVQDDKQWVVQEAAAMLAALGSVAAPALPKLREIRNRTKKDHVRNFVGQAIQQIEGGGPADAGAPPKVEDLLPPKR